MVRGLDRRSALSWQRHADGDFRAGAGTRAGRRARAGHGQDHIALTAFSITTVARTVRGTVLSAKLDLYIEVANALGRTTTRVLVQHIGDRLFTVPASRHAAVAERDQKVFLTWDPAACSLIHRAAECDRHVTK
jgi:hypothetical protein